MLPRAVPSNNKLGICRLCDDVSTVAALPTLFSHALVQYHLPNAIATKFVCTSMFSYCLFTMFRFLIQLDAGHRKLLQPSYQNTEQFTANLSSTFSQFHLIISHRNICQPLPVCLFCDQCYIHQDNSTHVTYNGTFILSTVVR